MTEYRILKTAAEVDQYITDDELSSAVDWFDDERTMPTDEYLDRLFPRYGTLADESGSLIELDSTDNEAARRIMSRARKLRKEREL